MELHARGYGFALSSLDAGLERNPLEKGKGELTATFP